MAYFHVILDTSYAVFAPESVESAVSKSIAVVGITMIIIVSSCLLLIDIMYAAKPVSTAKHNTQKSYKTTKTS